MGYEFEVRNNSNENYEMNCCLLEASFYVQESAFTQECLIVREMFFTRELQLGNVRMVVCGTHEHGAIVVCERSFQA